VQTVGVLDTTDFWPSLSEVTTAVNDPPTTPDSGRFEMVTDDGVLPVTLNDWSVPVAALYVDDGPVWASKVHIPLAMNCTSSPLAVQTVDVVDSTDGAPLLSVVMTAVNDPPTTPDSGRFEMVKPEGATGGGGGGAATSKLCALPVAPA